MSNPDHFDFIVVGSGLSALVFAALASQSGARVCVLEAHEYPGGYGHTFSMGKSAKFNAQFHYVWNCGKGETVHQVLSQLGLDEQVTFERLDPDGFDDMRVPGYSVKIPSSADELAKRLGEIAPESRCNIDRFLARVDQVASGLDLIASPKTVKRIFKDGINGAIALRHVNSSLQDVFDEFSLPRPVQALLASQWPDFLLPPDKLSFFAWVMLFTGYQRGAYYPTRHFEHVIDSLVQHILDHKGVVRCQQEVSGFELVHGRVSGVKVKDLCSSAQYTVTAEQTVSNMDPSMTADMVGRQHFSPRVLNKLRYEYSPSNFMIYCTVTGLDLKSFGFGRWNTFHSGDININRTFRVMYENHDYSNPSFAITTPGLMTTDCSDRPASQEVIEFLTVADHEYFNALLQDRRAYLRKKKEIVNQIFDVVEANYIPNFRQHVVFKVAGTPTTNERFCRSPHGNSYGSNMTPQNISRGRVPYKSSVPGLYFCNASSGFPGFAGAFWNGRSLFNRIS